MSREKGGIIQEEMDLSIIIVNYNVRHFLEQALLSVEKACFGIRAEIFVVDNNSADNSLAMVEERFPQVNIIANKENVGFAKANNQAIRLAKGQHILLLNPDTVVEEDTFVKCIQFMASNPDAGALGVRMIDGSGTFLPESKRGFPSPWVAFCKAFGLSKVFPKSKRFNQYHLGYLSEQANNPVDVLAGAFMFIRKKVLDEIGLLDEDFFMYGEDIDLSYRIKKGGYQNYYLADTSIIHYKGESTKKGSLNYVNIFYKAMLIFADKHLHGSYGFLYKSMIYLAVYFRAGLTITRNLFQQIALPLIDLIGITIGLYASKYFWASYYFENPNYFKDSFDSINIPLYSFIWLLSLLFFGTYSITYKWGKIFRSILTASLIIAAIYGFLPMEYRSSRVLILLGTCSTLIWIIITRLINNYHSSKSFFPRETPNIAIVGSVSESKKVVDLLNKSNFTHRAVGLINPKQASDPEYIGTIENLQETVQLHQIDELIFCTKNISTSLIIKMMSRLSPNVKFRILPEESGSIIGSHSKNSRGELYTIELQFNIASKREKQKKRALDISLATLFLIGFPLFYLLIRNRSNFFKNIISTFAGRTTWVGYHTGNDNDLPPISKGILNPSDPYIKVFNRAQFDLVYAKDYSIWKDLGIICSLSGFSRLGR